MIFEKILTPILEYYMSAPIDDLQKRLIVPKERIATIRNMHIIIYSNDHNPPHFHVKSKDKSINAKFTIDGCRFISGTISSKEVKRIKLFHSDIKTQIIMKKIWSKKNEF
jgi:hypothetical protein